MIQVRAQKARETFITSKKMDNQTNQTREGDRIKHLKNNLPSKIPL